MINSVIIYPTKSRHNKLLFIIVNDEKSCLYMMVNLALKMKKIFKNIINVYKKILLMIINTYNNNNNAHIFFAFGIKQNFLPN